MPNVGSHEKGPADAGPAHFVNFETRGTDSSEAPPLPPTPTPSCSRAARTLLGVWHG